MLAQIDQAESKAREAVFESNLNHVEARRRMDDFESLFLTLLNAAHTFDDKRFVEKGLKVSNKFATQPSVVGTGQFLFCNVNTKILYFFRAKAATDFLRSASAGNVDEIVKRVQEMALDGLIDPFNTPRTKMTWLSRHSEVSELLSPSGLPAAHWTPHDRDLAMDDAAIAAAVAVAGGIIIAVAGPVLVVVAAKSFAAGFALGGAVIIRWNDGSTPQPGQP